MFSWVTIFTTVAIIGIVVGQNSPFDQGSNCVMSCERAEMIDRRVRSIERCLGSDCVPDPTSRPDPTSETGGDEDDSNDDEEWSLVFRARSGNGRPVYETYVAAELDHDLDPTLEPGCTSVNGDDPCSFTYRSGKLTRWSRLGVKKVKLALYEKGEPVAELVFNGVGSNFLNWMSRDRLESSPWTDLTTTTWYQFFSLEGHFLANNDNRRFYINEKWGGCPNDSGWMVVIENSGNHQVCSFDKQSTFPQFLFSRRSGKTTYERHGFGKADVLAVFVQL